MNTEKSLAALTEDELFIATVRVVQRAAQGEANDGDEVSYDIAMQFMAESNRRLIAQGPPEKLPCRRLLPSLRGGNCAARRRP